MTDVVNIPGSGSRHGDDLDVDTSGVPFRITDEAYSAPERYYDLEFFRLENEKIWMREWQVACHLDEIPEPGDFTEYQILDQSILVIRQPDMSVKAFHNACRHRATALGLGAGSFHGEQVVCPFHGWRWNLDGTNSYVYTESAFRPDCVRRADLELAPVHVGVRFGFVWINLSDDPVPFEQNFDGIGPAIDAVGLDRMHVSWWHQFEFNCNWKIAQEAFFEAYHIMQTHPEQAMFLRDDDFDVTGLNGYFTMPSGHFWTNPKAPLRFAKVQPSGMFDGKGRAPAELLVATLHAVWDGTRAMTNEHYVAIADEILATLPHDQFFGEYRKRCLASAEERNVQLPPANPDAASRWTVFPHYTGLGSLGETLNYRSRPHPTDPNKCIYDFYGLSILPEGTPVKRAVKGVGPDPAELFIVQQDISNMERQQVGMHARGHQRNRLALDLEMGIIHWHQALDRKLAR